MLYSDYFIVLVGELDTKTFGVEAFGEIRNMLLQENVKYKVVRESN